LVAFEVGGNTMQTITNTKATLRIDRKQLAIEFEGFDIGLCQGAIEVRCFTDGTLTAKHYRYMDIEYSLAFCVRYYTEFVGAGDLLEGTSNAEETERQNALTAIKDWLKDDCFGEDEDELLVEWDAAEEQFPDYAFNK